MMEKAIRDFPKQFDYQPVIENKEKLVSREKFIVVGMGGSGLPARIVKAWHPEINIIDHHDYKLPVLSDDQLKERLIVVISYSGNTEETISSFETALRKNLSVAAISTGGKLLELAKKHDRPYIQIPDTGIEPRMGVGFSSRALLKMLGKEDCLKETKKLSALLGNHEEKKGKALSERLKSRVPVVYASTQNQAIAYIWKLKLNESGRIPAFYNIFPELNHTEIQGFDVADATRKLSEKLYFIFLKDKEDHPRVQKRMEVLEKIYRDRGLKVEVIELVGQSRAHLIFSALALIDWAAYHTATGYGVDPSGTPLVEEFKKLLE